MPQATTDETLTLEIIKSFNTKDFEFVVSLIACDDINVEIRSMTPFTYEGQRDRKRDTRVVMHLVGVGPTGMRYDATKQIRELRRLYTNQLLRVDPTKLFAAIRRIRPMIIDASNAANDARVEEEQGSNE